MKAYGHFDRVLYMGFQADLNIKSKEQQGYKIHIYINKSKAFSILIFFSN